MRRTPWLRRALVAAGLLMLFGLAAPAADNTPKDPPGTSALMGQLRATFAAWDLNKDGYLDKEELAKAFRGPNAKPYDSKADKDKPKDDKPKDGDKKDDNKPKDGDKKDGDPAKDPKGTGGGTTKPDYSKYPDYNFLVALDKDGDEKISKDEFETWARDYAASLKQQIDTLQRIADAEAKLAGGVKLTKKEQHALEKELKADQEAIKKLNKEAKSFEHHLQQAMKKHGKK